MSFIAYRQNQEDYCYDCEILEELNSSCFKTIERAKAAINKDAQNILYDEEEEAHYFIVNTKTAEIKHYRVGLVLTYDTYFDEIK